ncbi:MAG TPA: PKD domain-containing protein [Hymenobacter sp.]|nr:PKD domain-containing protein [Hymenobacter sp.]
MARAGNDREVQGDSMGLDGSASNDPDGDIMKWSWKQIEGLTASLQQPAAARTGVKGLQPGSYGFELQVEDNKGATARDTVRVVVVVNLPPVADAGPDLEITLPLNQAVFDGSKSYDPENTPLTYQWKAVGGPAGSAIAQSAAALTNVLNLVEGRYAFELEVRDGGGLTGKDTVQVTVLPFMPGQFEITLTLPLDSVYLPDLERFKTAVPCTAPTNQAYRQVTGPATADLRDTTGATVARRLSVGSYTFQPVHPCTGAYINKFIVHVVNHPPDPNTIIYHVATDGETTPDMYFPVVFHAQFNVVDNLLRQPVPQLFAAFSNSNVPPTTWKLLPFKIDWAPYVPYIKQTGEVGYASPEWMAPGRVWLKAKLQ